VGAELKSSFEEIVIIQCSIVVCHRDGASRSFLFKDAAPKAHPKK
jgi:hypothetical protein